MKFQNHAETSVTEVFDITTAQAPFERHIHWLINVHGLIIRNFGVWSARDMQHTPIPALEVQNESKMQSHAEAAEEKLHMEISNSSTP